MAFTRDYTGLAVLEAPQLVLVRLPGMKKCEECGGDAVARLDVSAGGSGYGCGSDHLHARTCSQISCSHGKLHGDECEPCDAEEEAKLAAPLALEEAIESIRQWAYTDSLVELEEAPLRQCLLDDVAATGTALPSEAEIQEFICGAEDGPTRVPALRRRFPKTDAWLTEQWGLG